MKILVGLLFAASALVGCGGGGPNAGECIFAVACVNNGTAGSNTPSTPPVSSFSRSGSGADVFNIPPDVNIIRIQGQISSASANFIVYAGGALTVNVILGSGQTPQNHDGTYVVIPGAQIQITNATGVNWTVSAAVSEPAPPAQGFTKSGSGNLVFNLPARSARYRIQATYSAASSNFIVYVAGSLVVNEIIGTSRNPSSFDGAFSLPSQGRVEIQGSSGVAWTITEVR